MSECKHQKVYAFATITGKPYPRNIKAIVILRCQKCEAILFRSDTERVPSSLLKGKQFNRQIVAGKELVKY